MQEERNNKNASVPEDPDDNMTFWGHLDVLRMSLFRILGFVLVAFIGCFISKYDKKNKADEELKKLLEKNLGNKVFSTVIPYSNIIRNSINYKMTAYEYMHWLSPAKKYVELTEEIIRKVG